ncbi:MAG: hypothetical protein OEW42_13700 [Acidimicrobiia bacterium]|nr:hypothetical protein [Acidimicrobiia bacterium]
MKLACPLVVAALAVAGCSSAADDPAPPDSSISTSSAVVDSGDSTDAPSGAPEPSTSTPGGALFDESLRAAVPNQPSGYPVAYYGDSLAHSAQEHVEEFLDAGLRFRFINRAFPGTALCDWLDEIERDRRDEDLWAVILVFSNNTFTPCMADASGEPLTEEAADAKFRDDLTNVVADFRSDGIRVYLPTLPLTRAAAESGSDDIAVANDIFADLAADDGGVVLIDAAASVLGPDGEYVEALPCLPIEPCVGGVDENGVAVNLVREPDGAHFCTGGYGNGVEIVPGNCPGWSSGAFRYAAAITGPIIEDGYRQWAADPASQDPVPIP